MEKLLNERQAAELLGISSRHLHTLRRRGEVPFLKLGGRVLYSPLALQRWIEDRLQRANVESAHAQASGEPAPKG
jgi:excisionase family DNA binding protein